MKSEDVTVRIVPGRAPLRIWCGAILLCGALGGAHAALFDDTEARRQIAAEKRRIDELGAQQQAMGAQQQAIDARIGRLEEALKNQALLDLFTQLEALKLEMSKLRGQIEVLNNSLENTGKRQRDMYVDLDTRLRRFEQQGAPAAVPSSAPSGTATPGGAASTPAPAAPGTPGASAAAAAAGAVATIKPPVLTPGPPAPPPAAAITGVVDPAAESRVYEAAQSQRRIGNYQGAIVALQNFIRQYPRSSLAPRAQYWIGDSYFNLRDFKLAIAAQQILIRTYPDSPSVREALLNIASSQIEMGESIAGRRSLEDLVAKYPTSEAADKARRRLAGMSVPAAAR